MLAGIAASAQGNNLPTAVPDVTESVNSDAAAGSAADGDTETAAALETTDEPDADAEVSAADGTSADVPEVYAGNNEKINTDLMFRGGWQNNGSSGFTISETSNADWTFTSGGYSYTVLDEDETGLYIYCNDSYGCVSSETVPDNNDFDPSNTKNIAHWLNNDFYNGKTAAKNPIKIDEKIVPYITEHEYFIEKNADDGEGKWVNCHIALISYNDWMNYHDRIGYRTNQYIQGTLGMMMTRTPMKGTGSMCFCAQRSGNMSNTSVTAEGTGYSLLMIRPAFYISRDYFRNVKADTFGSEIGNIISECNTRESLEEMGYSRKDVIMLSGSGEYDKDVSVRNVRVFGTLKPGYTLTAEYVLSDAAQKEESVTGWYISDNEDDGYTEVAQGDTYKLTNADAGKYIKASVLPVSSDMKYGDEVYSAAVTVGDALIPFTSTTKNNSGVYSLERFSAPTYTFIDGDYQYVCLEAEDNGIFVLGDYSVGLVSMSPKPSDNSFDLKSSSNMAYWLNVNYLAGEKGRGGKAINPNTLKYILEREYVTEGCGVSGTPHENDTVDVCKVAYLSWNEMLKYQDRIGYESTDGTYSADTYDNKRRLLMRTPQLGSVINNMYSVPETGNVQPASAVNNNYYNIDVRPVMLISYDYFKNVPLDISKLGDGVKEMLREHISRSELENIYSAAELSELGYGAESVTVTADSVLTGFAEVGQQLFADSAAAEEQDLEYVYKWYYADSADGEYTLIEGAADRAYTVDERYEGKYIRCRTEVYDGAGNEFCAAYTAESDKIGEHPDFAVITDVELESISGGRRANIKTVNYSGEERNIRIVFAAFTDTNMMTLPCAQKEISAAEGENVYSIDLPTDGNCFFRITVYGADDAEPLCGVTIR